MRKFLSPRKRDVWYVKSGPASQLPERPNGSPTVAMKPAEDSSSTFWRIRTTPIVLALCSVSTSRVLTASAPKFSPPTRPLILPPALIGTCSPSMRPMRRLKKGIKSSSRPSPKSKMSAPSRKNVRFSGKNNGKRVRLTRRASTSVSAKSVFAVSDASVLAPTRCVTSRLACPWLRNGGGRAYRARRRRSAPA